MTEQEIAEKILVCNSEYSKAHDQCKLKERELEKWRLALKDLRVGFSVGQSVWWEVFDGRSHYSTEEVYGVIVEKDGFGNYKVKLPNGSITQKALSDLRLVR
jgi:hypothetical protein